MTLDPLTHCLLCSALEALRNRAVQIDIYLLTYCYPKPLTSFPYMHAFLCRSYYLTKSVCVLFSYVFVALLLYGWSAIPFVYVLSFFCKVVIFAFGTILGMNLVLGT